MVGCTSNKKEFQHKRREEDSRDLKGFDFRSREKVNMLTSLEKFSFFPNSKTFSHQYYNNLLFLIIDYFSHILRQEHLLTT